MRPYRVDLVIIYADGQTDTHMEAVRQGVTSGELREAAAMMDDLSNVYPVIFGPPA